MPFRFYRRSGSPVLVGGISVGSWRSLNSLYLLESRIERGGSVRLNLIAVKLGWKSLTSDTVC